MGLNINLDIILKRPLIQRVLILVAVNAIIGGLIFYLMTMPKIAEIAVKNTLLAVKMVELNDSRTIAQDIKKFQSEKGDLQKQLDLALAQLPNEKEIPDLIDSISDAVKDVGLKTFLFQPMTERVKGFYAEVPVNMEVQGGYESLYEFTDRIGKLPRIVNIGNINIVLTGETKGFSPVLKSTFVVTTFRFIPTPAPAK